MALPQQMCPVSEAFSEVFPEVFPEVFQVPEAKACNSKITTFLSALPMQRESPFALAGSASLILSHRDSSLTPLLFHNEPKLRHLYRADREQ